MLNDRQLGMIDALAPALVIASNTTPAALTEAAMLELMRAALTEAAERALRGPTFATAPLTLAGCPT
jgi:hypothetical protein